MITLNPGQVTLAELRAIWEGAPVRLADSGWIAIDSAREHNLDLPSLR